MPVSREEAQAARRYLEHDHAAHHLKGEPARIANENAKQIDEQHERARDIALTGTSQELGQLPPHLRAHQIRSRKQAGITTEHAARIRAAYRAGDTPRRSPGHGARNRRAAPRPRSAPTPPPPRTVRSTAAGAGRTVASTAGDAVSAAAGTGFGGLVVQMFAWGMGLSLLYLVLRYAGNTGRIFKSGVNATRAVVGVNIDPLNPHGVLVPKAPVQHAPSGGSGGVPPSARRGEANRVNPQIPLR